MKYFMFLDETGDHGLSYIDKNFPLFLLCGLIIDEESLSEITSLVEKFKKKFFHTTQVILHSRDIRKCEGPFQALFDLELKENFYKDMNEILGLPKYRLIGSGIQKDKLVRRYGKGAKDPYALSLSFVIERLVFYLDTLDKHNFVQIVAEERGKKENRELLAHFNSIVDRGTYFVAPARLRSKIRGFSFHNKRENVLGLQLADLCAYPMARHLLNPAEPYIPFQVICDKIYADSKGKYMGWGLKLFP